LRYEITIRDAELLKHLDAVDPTLVDENVLIYSVMSCTLCEQDRKYLLNKLTVSSPELLVRVVARCICDVRDYLLQETNREEVIDVLLSISSLVRNMTSVIDLEDS
jgi:hypothetical protein